MLHHDATRGAESKVLVEPADVHRGEHWRKAHLQCKTSGTVAVNDQLRRLCHLDESAP